MRGWAGGHDPPFRVDPPCVVSLYFLGVEIKSAATGCQVEVVKLKFTEFDIGWGSVSDPAGRAYRARPDL